MRKLLILSLSLVLGVVAYLLLEAERSKRRKSAAGASRPAGTRGCLATTGSGAPCSRLAEPGSGYCWQHGGRG